MEIKVLYQDKDVLVVDKPASIVVFPENKVLEKTLIDYLLKEYPELEKVGQAPRYGIVHRLDKDTSGVLLVAKNNESLKFFQKRFKERKVEKKYLALLTGEIKPSQGKIETLIGRSPQNPKKQKAFSFLDPEAKKKGLRRAITEYRVLKKFSADQKEIYTLIEAIPITGRKHQIRCHFSYFGYPIAGDKLYGFKNQKKPENLKRHFLHASYLKIELPTGEQKEFKSPLPQDLQNVVTKLKNF